MPSSPFWQTVRNAAKAASQAVSRAYSNRPSGAIDSGKLSARQQAILTGHGPGWWTSDHLEELRHMLGWVYVGVNAVADQWMQATVNVYDKSRQDNDALAAGTTPSGAPLDVDRLRKELRRWRTKEAAQDTQAEKLTPLPDHPAARLLENPNPYTSGAVFRYQMACQVRLTGGCYIWEVPDQYGEPRHLWVIPRGWMRPQPPTGAMPEGSYWITPTFNTFTQGITSPTMAGWTIDRREVIAFGRPDPLYPGEFKSPLSACAQMIDIAEQTDTATWSKFVNEVKPGLVFSIDPKTGPPPKAELERFMADLRARKAGATNQGESLVAHGLTVQALYSGPSELDYVNGRNQNRDNLLSIQRVPAGAAGITQESSYAGLAVAIKQMVELSIEPDLMLFAGALTHRWRKVWGPDFKVEAQARNYDDPTLKLQKADKILAAVGAGVHITHNEVRAAIDLPPRADGDEIIQQQAPEMGAPAEQDPYADFESSDLDLGDEMGGETQTGMRQPLRQQASGNVQMNGNGRY